MKRTILLFAACLLSLWLSASSAEDAVSSATLDIQSVPQAAAANGTGTAVLYFSTDDTIRAAALTIADALQAEAFEIVPEEPYTEEDLNYSDPSSRATAEQREEGARPGIAQLPDTAHITTLFLGYPIWWGQAPKILCTLVESIDLTGKTVIPFCTSGSSGAGSSADRLRDLSRGEAEWLPVMRFENGTDAETIRAWAKSFETEAKDGMKMTIGDTRVQVAWEDNESVRALSELAENGLQVNLSMYGGFEQVGHIGQNLPHRDSQTTTQAGDIVLYMGNQIVVFYGSNSWDYTRLGRITDKNAQELRELLGNGNVTLFLEAQ